jgi:hypothetical protein
MYAVRRIAGDEDCHPAQHEAKHVSDGELAMELLAATTASSEVNKLVWLSVACPSCSSVLIVHRPPPFVFSSFPFLVIVVKSSRNKIQKKSHQEIRRAA